MRLDLAPIKWRVQALKQPYQGEPNLRDEAFLRHMSEKTQAMALLVEHVPELIEEVETLTLELAHAMSREQDLLRKVSG